MKKLSRLLRNVYRSWITFLGIAKGYRGLEYENFESKWVKITNDMDWALAAEDGYVRVVFNDGSNVPLNFFYRRNWLTSLAIGFGTMLNPDSFSSIWNDRSKYYVWVDKSMNDEI